MPMSSSAACRRAALVVSGLAALCRPAAAADTDFVKVAQAHGGFGTFLSLVSRAGLADTLGAVPVTVFMPTDGAFSRLPAAQRTSIDGLSPDGAKDFVDRFVFPGTPMASNDIDKTITSKNGTVFDVTWYVGRLSLRDHRGPATGRLAYVVQGDIPAGRGVIDAVDAVLMPAALGVPAVPVAAAPAAVAAVPAPGASAVPGTPTPTLVPAAPGTLAPAVAAQPDVPSQASAVPGTPAPTPMPAPVAAVAPNPPPAAALPPAPASPALAAVPPGPAAPATPVLTVAAAGLRGWPLKVSGNGSTGKVNGVMIGLPDGRVAGLSAHFGGFLGFGGRNVYVPWDRVVPDDKAHVLRVHMTAAEFAAAPAVPPKP